MDLDRETPEPDKTEELGEEEPGWRRFDLTVVDADGGEAPWRFTGEAFGVGAHPSNDLVVKDRAVSRFHCEVSSGRDGVQIRDLGSRNGTTVDGVRVTQAFLRPDSVVRIGRVALRFAAVLAAPAGPSSAASRFGDLVGTAPSMRVVYALLERAAAADATVLLEGETGTGKGAAAEALHQQSARSGKPFVVVDCGAVPVALMESELFGHERGAFTGADARRVGAFEEADGGTIFLDEIGELPLDVQPKLLRVLENRQVRRLGQNQQRSVDVRIVAATHHDLRRAVNEGRFRADLYYRLAVLRVRLPSLRERMRDLPAIAAQLLEGLGAGPARRAPLLAAEFLATLQRSQWPGNVRELRNYLERCLVLESPPPVHDGEGDGPARAAAAAPTDAEVDTSRPFPEARRVAAERFERAYLEALLARHQGKVPAAARAAGVSRVYLYRLMARHGIATRRDGED